jgi:hypothetical protein
MYLLESVEQKLGHIDIWPTYIIQYLFMDVPSEPIVKCLVSFFYGNCIPVNTATQLYSVCNHICTVNASDYTVQHTKCYGNETGYTLLI